MFDLQSSFLYGFGFPGSGFSGGGGVLPVPDILCLKEKISVVNALLRIALPAGGSYRL
jgi:hypothetical protein